MTATNATLHANNDYIVEDDRKDVVQCTNHSLLSSLRENPFLKLTAFIM